MFCTHCNKEMLETTKHQRDYYRLTGRIYCRKVCRFQYNKEIFRKNMISTNKKYASKRMKVSNPSFNAEIIKKIKETKKKNGTLNLRPKILGGNGRETPLPVKMLNNILNWEIRYILVTGHRSYYPTHYKLEIANVEKKIAIEVDGQAYYSRKELAKKKEDFLKSKGWLTIRIKNKEVLSNINECIDRIRLLESKREQSWQHG